MERTSSALPTLEASAELRPLLFVSGVHASYGTVRVLHGIDLTVGQGVDLVFDTIDRLARTGLTILLVEQNAVAALDVADRAYVIERGRIVHSGPADSMLALPEIQASYLGTRHGGTPMQ